MRASDDVIRDVLTRYKRIAVIGLSPRPERASYHVTKYMIDAGYEIFGVRPAQKEILGRPCYASISEVPKPLEIVDVFRASEAIPELVDELLPLKPKVLWLQEGVSHPEAERKASAAGIVVISDRCILKEHMRLC
jgi:predicted CoA-binding protein